MSHIVQIETQVKDPAAVQAACRRLGLPEAVQGTTKLFSGRATGLAVQLPGWHYPAVFDLTSGQVRYDNYGGNWGKQCELEKFLQSYAVEKAKIEARRRGHTATEQQLADGSIKLTIQVAGGASMSKIIEIVVSPTGQTTVQTKGFTGSSCQDASRFIEQALGKPTGETLTAEFYHTVTTQQHLQEGA